ncbi:hypothetical protein [Thiomicrospira microaerophila]|uniref:hypothetical protein n=1 Tax=Thiomicrospira microaerophila TaxID=406020 RepID=UPI0006969D45|nr:hypothetical protein [Thiomicrospira microaerophila]
MQARFIDSQQQAEDYWLIQLELCEPPTEPWPIGSQFRSDNNPAWLMQTATRQNLKFSLLSHQAWLYQPQQILDLKLIKPTNSVYPAQPNWQQNQLWLASDLAMAAVFDAAKRWQQAPKPKGAFIALLHAPKHFPFRVKPARFMLPLDTQASEAIGASSLLEDWGIPNRLACSEFLPGCLESTLDRLYQAWQEGQHDPQAFQVIQLNNK